ncbi:MAG: glycosyltransferase family 4 protein [Phycisphaerales bacterium]|nr:glycosyltransferase family 4 protein [Phycisphaerales bacterium]
MRIGVNAVPLRVSGGGARFVFTELMDRLLALDTRNQYVIFAHFLGLPVINQIRRIHPHLNPHVPHDRRVSVIEVSNEDDIFHHRHEFDLFFGPLNNLQPRIYDRPSVAILHDIQEQFFPQYFSEGDLLARREIYPEICRSATTLVTISEFCKQTIVDKFAIDPHKVEVIYNAPQTALVDRAADDDGEWRREPLPERFFFYPANTYLHKNHETLLDAIALLRRRLGGACPGFVFTGYELPGGCALKAGIESRGIADICRTFNEVHVDELRYLFRSAIAIVMPTMFEGFGMPVVEAMACGCPVACSDLPVLREIGETFALYFDPCRAEAIADSMMRLSDDAPLRARLRDAGMEHARRFTWERSARRMLEIFDEAADRFIGLGGPAHREGDEHLPHIGVLVASRGRGLGLPEALKSVLSTGYSRLSIQVVFLEPPDDNVRAFLERSPYRFEVIDGKEGVTWELLARFAHEHELDLVGEVHAPGGGLLPSALHSLASCFHRDRSRSIYLGEAWEWHHGRVIGDARLRLMGDGLWRMQGFLYPEMMWLNPEAMSRWEAVDDLVREGGGAWRWTITREAQLSGRIALLKRTLALIEPGRVSLADRFRAGQAGLGVVHQANGTPHSSGWLSRLEPVLRPASRVLPTRVREHGKRIWQHLKNEP